MQSINFSSVHGAYGDDQADVSQESIQGAESSTATTVHHDALSSHTAEGPEETKDSELLDFAGDAGIAGDDPGTSRSQTAPLNRMPSLNGSIHSEFSELVFGDSEQLVFATHTPEPEASSLNRAPSFNGLFNDDNGSIHSNVSKLAFGDAEHLPFASNPPEPKARTPEPEAHTSGPAPKTGDPKQDVPSLTKAELLDAIDEHYGEPTWASDFRPHLTKDQREVVQGRIQNLPNAKLHDAIEKHYGTPTWNSDFRPHLTKDQREVVQGQLKNIDEELGIEEKPQVNKKPKLIPDNLAEAINLHYGTPEWKEVEPYLTSDQREAIQGMIKELNVALQIGKYSRGDKPSRLLGADKPTRLRIDSQPNKLRKKRPDYTEYRELQRTPMPELSDRARALKLMAAKKKAEGALMPKASAYTDYYTSPKNMIRSAKNTFNSITGKKEDQATAGVSATKSEKPGAKSDEPQNT